MSDILFSSLEIEGWRQFDDVELRVHPRLTVVTGANGSGKSTLLSVFNRHFGWTRSYLSTPIKDNVGTTSYITGIISDFWHIIRFQPRPDPNNAYIGRMVYSNSVNSDITVGMSQGIQYGLSFSSQQPVSGIHIDSYRNPPVYNQVGKLNLQPITARQAYDQYHSEIIQKSQGGYTDSSPVYRMKEAIISMAVFGEGNAAIGRNQSYVDMLSGFEDVLRNLLPSSLGFEKISIRSPDVVLVTKSGDFMLDASSGGVLTLIDIAWRIYMFSREHKKFVVTMDEPENHLHPSMQRSLMRKLLKAFPNVQFIIATHSPFMVTSVEDSNVFVLRYESSQGQELTSAAGLRPMDSKAISAASRVRSLQLTSIDRAASASDILRDVLGVSATMPEWVEERLDGVVKSFAGKEITKEMLGDLRRSLSEIGYSEYYPEALANLTGR